MFSPEIASGLMIDTKAAECDAGEGRHIAHWGGGTGISRHCFVGEGVSKRIASNFVSLFDQTISGRRRMKHTVVLSNLGTRQKPETVCSEHIRPRFFQALSSFHLAI